MMANPVLSYIDSFFMHLEPLVKIAQKNIEKSVKLINGRLSSFQPLQLIAMTLAAVWLVRAVISVITPPQGETRWAYIKRKFFSGLLYVPFLGSVIDKEIGKVGKTILKDLMKPYKGMTFITELPKKGLERSTVIEKLDKYLAMGSIDWHKGRVSGTVYADCNDKVYSDFLVSVYGKTFYTNPLHADVFPGIRKMEAEVVRMTCSLFNGGPKTCGTMTTGGTESILLVCKAYRDYAHRITGIRDPEFVVPVTAHAAFEKAAQMLNVTIHYIPVDKNTYKVDLKAMKRAINNNTCMLLGSAPQFPHGIIDPIPEIAKLGLKYKIPVHVDACLGGFLVPFAKALGYNLPPCDFSVEGVTSISADTHKYGYSPKGTSVIMYSDPKYRHYQYSVQTDWPGGIYATQNISGSRAGGLIATCWASLVHNGYDRYLESARKILSKTKYLKEKLSEINGIFVIGDPLVSVVAVGSNHFNIFRLGDGLSKRGWSLNQLQFPSAFHICVTLMHTNDEVSERLLSDIKELTEELLKTPNAKLEGQAAVYGLATTIPDRSMVSTFARQFLDGYYCTDTNLIES